MGSGGFSPMDYTRSVKSLQSTGQTFKTSATAAKTGNYRIDEILDPRKLKNGMRESCFAPGFTSALPVIIAMDGTGSMDKVPVEMQTEIPKLMGLITGQGISDHPNLMFMMLDDEFSRFSDALFQMSQFETGHQELIESLNRVIIPGDGGGNHGESYHIAFYAAANHTRIECFDRDQEKGFFFLICDEEPYPNGKDPRSAGMRPHIAKDIFGDVFEIEIPMIESIRKTLERYHVFIIRPKHTSHGQNQSIARMWQQLLSDAGGNPEHVIHTDKTEDIVTTISAIIGRTGGMDDDQIVDLFGSKAVADATRAIVPIDSKNALTVGKSTTVIMTSDIEKQKKIRR